MRHTTLGLFALCILIAQPVVAGDIPARSPVFGRAYCRPTFPCSDTTNEDSRAVAERISTMAESCIRTTLGVLNPPSEGYIERAFGLDGSLCLTTRTLPKNGEEAVMTPKCCVQPVASSETMCQLVCTKYSVK